MIHPPTPTSRRHRNQVVQVPHWHWNKIRHRKQRIEYIRMSSTLGFGMREHWGSGKDQGNFFIFLKNKRQRNLDFSFREKVVDQLIKKTLKSRLFSQVGEV